MTTSSQSSSSRSIDTDEEDTIEILLNGTQMQVLAQAAPAERPDTTAPQHESEEEESEEPPAATKRLRVAMGIGIGAAIAVLAGGAYVAATRTPNPVHITTSNGTRAVSTAASAPSAPVETPAPDVEPVLFTNPFDRTEVFTFPPGTSMTEARDAVADILSKRAQERFSSLPKSPHVKKKVTDASVKTADNSSHH